MPSSSTHALETLCITGGPRSGKTSALVGRALAWGGQDAVFPRTQPAFLFFCATPWSVDTVQSAVANASEDGVVCTPFDYALRILEDPRVRALTGRTPHVLSPAEEAVFYEDLKTSGLKRRRLRELWAFLMCGWANLDDDDPAWICTTEETAQLELARQILALDDAMLAGEVVNLAVHALRELPDVRREFSSPVVLADDYPLMSRASQELIDLLACDKLAVAGNPEPTPVAFEPYPCAQGLDLFCQHHPSAERVALDEPLHQRKRDHLSAPDLGQEMGLVVSTVVEALNAGTAPERIAVVGVNRTWRANLLRALRSCNIPAEELRLKRQRPLGREMSEPDEAERVRVLKRLADNAGDSVAWRQWLSFGDALGRSAAVAELRRVAEPAGLTLAEALPLLASGKLEGLPMTSPFAQSLLKPYRQALETLKVVELSREDAPAAAPAVGGGQDEMAANAGETPETPGTVVVAKPEDLFGHTFDLVIFGGFVNGFIPSRDLCDVGKVVGGARERALAADHAALRLVEGRTSERLVFTSFESCPLEAAEQLGLHIARIALKDGQRICTIEPSSYLEEMGL